jgi:hypothetical protein
MKPRFSRTISILLAICVYSLVVFLVLGSTQDGGSKALVLLVAVVGIGGATVAILRYQRAEVRDALPSSPEVLLKVLRIVALAVFVSVWSMQMICQLMVPQPLRPLLVPSIRLQFTVESYIRPRGNNIWPREVQVSCRSS